MSIALIYFCFLRLPLSALTKYVKLFDLSPKESLSRQGLGRNDLFYIENELEKGFLE